MEADQLKKISGNLFRNSFSQQKLYFPVQ